MEIGIWGDSIAYGEGDSEGLGWVGRLRKELLNEANVYNRGVCGDTSSDLLGRFPAELASLEPNKIIIAIGINDSKFPVNENKNLIPLKNFKKNLKNLVTQAEKYTNEIYFVGLTRISGESIRPSRNKFINLEIEKYDDVVKQFSESERLKYIFIANTLDLGHDLSDGLHPNAKGYQKIFESVSKHLN